MRMFYTAEAAIEAAVRAGGYRSPLYDVRVQSNTSGRELAMEVKGKVFAILGRFKQRDQDIAILWAIGHSYREIARALGVSDRTVRRRWEVCWPMISRRLLDVGVLHTT